MISIILVGRTISGFHQLIDHVSSAFKSEVSTQLIDFPVTRSFRSSREQYDAEMFLKEMNIVGNGKTTFLIREDIFVGPLDFVFGFAKNNHCVVSTVRLDPRFYGEKDMSKASELFKERIRKEVLHELGHTLGLSHCSGTCIMVHSDSINGVDKKGLDFCEDCKLKLKKQELTH